MIELLAVLFILAVATSVVGISISSTLEKSRLRQEVAGVRNLMGYARDKALTERRPVIFYVKKNGSYGLEGGRALVIGKGLKFKSDSKVIFFPKGNSSGGEVGIVSAEGRAYRVYVDPATGESSIKRL